MITSSTGRSLVLLASYVYHNNLLAISITLDSSAGFLIDNILHMRHRDSTKYVCDNNDDHDDDDHESLLPLKGLFNAFTEVNQ
jgi:hypothetical protein